MKRSLFHLSLFALIALGSFLGPAISAHEHLSVEKTGSKFRIMVGNEEFAELDYSTYARPIVYPIYGPGQVPMTRNYPMQLGFENEATDHPHHKAIWFAHGELRRSDQAQMISFWHEQGKIITERIEDVNEDEHRPSITIANKLVAPDQSVVARETVTIAFSASKDARLIDYSASIHASEAALVFGDTKEGTMAIRTHPNLRVRGKSANATATNSNGESGGSIWGKRAKWVDYSGTIDEQKVGISIFDHPSNLRHPTTWHARDYGLVAANPFGLSDFIGKSEDGTFKLEKGESLNFSYRFVFHRGNAQEANVQKMYEDFAGSE